MVNVAERIQELLREKNMTQYQLAKRSGVSQSSLNTIIKRGTSPSFKTICQICEGFDISLSYFAEEYEGLNQDIQGTFREATTYGLESALYQSIVVENGDYLEVICQCAEIAKKLRDRIQAGDRKDAEVNNHRDIGDIVNGISEGIAKGVMKDDEYDYK